MIIDGDTHVSVSRERHGQTAAELVEKMDLAGVDRAVTWLHPLSNGSLRSVEDMQNKNENVFQSTKQFPERLIGFGWVDPTLGRSACRDQIKRCLQDFGMHGIKFHGGLNTYFIDDPEVSLPVVEDVAREKTVLAFHCGADAPDETNPFRIGKIARAFPDCTILMVHGGGVGWNNTHAAAIEIANQYPNIYMIGSTLRTLNVLSAVRALGAQKVCFGSDCPFSLMHADVAAWNAILDHEVQAEEKAMIMGGNLQRIFGIYRE